MGSHKDESDDEKHRRGDNGSEMPFFTIDYDNNDDESVTSTGSSSDNRHEVKRPSKPPPPPPPPPATDDPSPPGQYELIQTSSTDTSSSTNSGQNALMIMRRSHSNGGTNDTVSSSQNSRASSSRGASPAPSLSRRNPLLQRPRSSSWASLEDVGCSVGSGDELSRKKREKDKLVHRWVRSMSGSSLGEVSRNSNSRSRKEVDDDAAADGKDVATGSHRNAGREGSSRFKLLSARDIHAPKICCVENDFARRRRPEKDDLDATNHRRTSSRSVVDNNRHSRQVSDAVAVPMDIEYRAKRETISSLDVSDISHKTLKPTCDCPSGVGNSNDVTEICDCTPRFEDCPIVATANSTRYLAHRSRWCDDSRSLDDAYREQEEHYLEEDRYRQYRPQTPNTYLSQMRSGGAVVDPARNVSRYEYQPRHRHDDESNHQSVEYTPYLDTRSTHHHHQQRHVADSDSDHHEPEFDVAEYDRQPQYHFDIDYLTDLNIRRRKINFTTVEIRMYDRILGDNPSCSNGPSISIGWRHFPEDTVRATVDEYEITREPQLESYEMILPRKVREKLLLELGYSRQHIAEAVRMNVRTKNQRRQTVHNLPVARVEETLESVKRKVKRIFKKKKKQPEKMLMAASGEKQRPVLRSSAKREGRRN